MKMVDEKEKQEVMFVSSIRKYESGKTRAFATVRLYGVMVTGIRLVELKEGDFSVEMPQTKGKDGKYYNSVWFDLGCKDDNKDAYDMLTKIVYQAYKQL